jgi:hypothetical protein
MGQAIGWLVALAVVGLMIWALSRENTRQRNRSSEEYERDIYAARESMLRAGLLQLDKFVGEAKGKQAAVEFLKDEEQGQTRTGSIGDDAERTLSKSQNESESSTSDR